MPRRALLVCFLALSMACGRIGYDPLDGSAMDSDVPDGPPMDGRVDTAPDATDTGVGDTGGPDDTGVDTAVPDAGPCDDDPCRLVLPQCGCPGGQMCTRVTPGSAERSCAPNGALPAGSTCTFSTECQPGASCIQANGVGICSLWCEADAHCPTTECLRLRVADPVGACRVVCDPVADTGCPGGTTCYAAQGEAIGGPIITITICGGAGSTGFGSTCMFPFECVPGAVCAAGTCEEVCDTSTPTCSAGTCTDLGWDPVDGQTLGACR